MKIIRIPGRTSHLAEQLLCKLEARGATNTARLEPAVRKIINDVRRRGDKAVLAYTHKFDGLLSQQQLHITPAEMESAWSSISPSLRAALTAAAKNIRAFAKRQLPKNFAATLTPGVRTGQLIRAIDAVGCYVPGGRYPLPSTLLMTVIPAQVAGVPRIVVTSPRPAPETLAAAHLLGVQDMLRIGGAQAIAALAYGTESIGPVNKIVGPGNLYVTTAKKLVAFDCGIDMLAGPTEIVVTSESGNPAFIASDLVAQAEHDPEALAILITSNSELATATVKEVRLKSRSNPIARQSLGANGYVFVTSSIKDSQSLTNRLAPEHLSVDSASDLSWIRSAGSVFIGDHTPQSMGDYISGPNHTLPTSRIARTRGGLSVLDFLKLITVQEYTRAGLARLGPHAAILADAEGLAAHAASVRLRLEEKESL